MRQNRRSIALFYLVCFLQGMVFYSPVATLYRQAAGVSLLQIGTIESLSLITMLALEIPWGCLADRLGQRRTLVLCAALYAGSKVIFWRADSFGDFLWERLVMAVALAGLSGCDAAYLTACCGAGETQLAFSRWEGIQTAGLFTAALCWPLLGGNYRLAALLTVITYAAAALCTLGLRDPAGAVPHGREKQTIPLKTALGHTLALAPVLLACCLARESLQMITVFLGQLQFVRAGVPPQLFGFAQGAVIAAGLAGVLAHRLLRYLGTRRCGVLLLSAGALGCLVLAGSRGPVVALLLLPLLRGVQALLAPLFLAVQTDHAAPQGRATQLSCNAMLMDLGALALYPAFGGLAECGVAWAMLLGGLCLILAIPLFLMLKPSTKERN